ncbi:MAG: hypothetical protein WDN49_06845 [Acetobacteraceae bacterium]
MSRTKDAATSGRSGQERLRSLGRMSLIAAIRLSWPLLLAWPLLPVAVVCFS